MKKIYELTDYNWITEYEKIETYWDQVLIAEYEIRKSENGEKYKKYIYKLINLKDIDSGVSAYYTDTNKINI